MDILIYIVIIIVYTLGNFCHADIDSIVNFNLLTNSSYLCNNIGCVPTASIYPSNWNILSLYPSQCSPISLLTTCPTTNRLGVWPIQSQNGQYEGIVAQLPSNSTLQKLYLGLNINNYTLNMQTQRQQSTTESILVLWLSGTVLELQYGWFSMGMCKGLCPFEPQPTALHCLINHTNIINLLYIFGLYIGMWFPDVFVAHSVWNPTLNIFQGKWNFPIQYSIYNSTLSHVSIPSKNLVLYDYTKDNLNKIYTKSWPNNVLSPQAIVLGWNTTIFPLETILNNNILFKNISGLYHPFYQSIILDLQLDQYWFVNNGNNSVFNYPHWKLIYNTNNTMSYINTMVNWCYWQLSIDGVIISPNQNIWDFPNDLWNNVNTSIWVATNTNTLKGLSSSVAQISSTNSNYFNLIQGNNSCIKIQTDTDVQIVNTLQTCIIYISTYIIPIQYYSLIQWRKWPFYNTYIDNLNPNLIQTNSSLWWDLLPYYPLPNTSTSIFINRIDFQPLIFQSFTSTVVNQASWSFNDQMPYWAIYPFSTVKTDTIFYGPASSLLQWDFNLNNDSYCTCVNCNNNWWTSSERQSSQTIWSCSWSGQSLSLFHFQFNDNVAPLTIVPHYNQPVTINNASLYEWAYFESQWWLLSNLNINKSFNTNCPIEYIASTNCTEIRYGKWLLERGPFSNSHATYVFLFQNQLNYSQVQLVISNGQIFSLSLINLIWEVAIPLNSLILPTILEQEYSYYYLINANQIMYQYEDMLLNTLPRSIYSDFKVFFGAEYSQWNYRLKGLAGLQGTAVPWLLLEVENVTSANFYTKTNHSNWNISALIVSNHNLYNSLKPSLWTWSTSPIYKFINLSDKTLIQGNLLQTKLLGYSFILIISNESNVDLIDYLNNQFGVYRFRNYDVPNVEFDSSFSTSVTLNQPFQWNVNEIQQVKENNINIINNTYYNHLLYPLLVPGIPNVEYDSMLLFNNFTLNMEDNLLLCYGNYNQSCGGDQLILSQNDGKRWSTFRYYSDNNRIQQTVYTLLNRSPFETLYVSIYLQNVVFLNLIPSIAYGNYTCQTLPYTCISGYENTFTCLLEPQTLLIFISPIADSYTANSFTTVSIPSTVINTINSCLLNGNSASSSSGVHLSSSSSSISKSSSSSSSSTGTNINAIQSSSSSSILSIYSSSTGTNPSNDPWTYINITSSMTLDPTPEMSNLKLGM